MYLSENSLFYSAPQHNGLDFSRGQLEDITVHNYSIMSAAKTSGRTELQYTVAKSNILLAYTCLTECCECQQEHRKQRNLTDVLHTEQWSTAMLYPYLLKWNIFPTWFFYSASSCFHIITNMWAVPVWSGQLTRLVGWDCWQGGTDSTQSAPEVNKSSPRCILKWLSTFPFLPPQTVVTSSCSASLEENVSPGFAVLTTLLWTDRLLLLFQAKIQ